MTNVSSLTANHERIGAFGDDGNIPARSSYNLKEQSMNPTVLFADDPVLTFARRGVDSINELYFPLFRPSPADSCSESRALDRSIGKRDMVFRNFIGCSGSTPTPQFSTSVQTAPTKMPTFPTEAGGTWAAMDRSAAQVGEGKKLARRREHVEKISCAVAGPHGATAVRVCGLRDAAGLGAGLRFN